MRLFFKSKKYLIHTIRSVNPIKSCTMTKLIKVTFLIVPIKILLTKDIRKTNKNIRIN